jgi:hypothetical protein
MEPRLHGMMTKDLNTLFQESAKAMGLPKHKI